MTHYRDTFFVLENEAVHMPDN